MTWVPNTVHPVGGDNGLEHFNPLSLQMREEFYSSDNNVHPISDCSPSFPAFLVVDVAYGQFWTMSCE